MKVKDLIAALADLNPEAEVILQKDAEGNGYSPLSGADPDAVYVEESTYSGTVYSSNWSAQDACMTNEEWAELLAQPRCVVLFPVN